MKTIKKINESYIGETPIATTIDSSSTNSEVASAKAVYDRTDSFFCNCVSDGEFTLSSTNVYTTVPLKIQSTNDNDAFEISSGELLVKKNGLIGIISFWGTISPSASTSRTRFLQVPGASMVYTNVTANTTTLLTSPVSFKSCEAGDSFKLQMYGQSGDKITNGNAGLKVLFIGTTDSNSNVTRTLNLMGTESTDSLTKLGNKEEVSGETLEKTKLDEVTDKDVGEQITEVKEAEPTKEIEESGDKGE